MEYRYAAFISYSHRDKRVGDWLHRKLETYRVPKALVTEKPGGRAVPARIFPVFRDREELPTSSDLGAQISDALEGSRFLVVICSPNSARSRWVNEEIRAFKALGREADVLCLVIDGEPNASDLPGREDEECFPQAVRFRVAEDGTLSDQRTEPIAADLRPHADGRANALLKLIAGLLGVGFDDLKQRELRRRQRRLAIATAVLSVVTVAMAGLAVSSWLGWQRAERQEHLALKARDQAEELASTMLFDFRDKLEPLGRLDLLKENALLVRDYYVSLPTEHQDDQTERRRATSLMSVGDVLVGQGALAEAAQTFAASEAIFARLRDQQPGNLDALRSWTVIINRLGDERARAGDYANARKYFDASIAATRQLLDAPAAKDAWERDLIVSLYKLGQLQLDHGDHDGALRAFDEALKAAKRNVEAGQTRQRRLDMVTILSGIAQLHETRREKRKTLEYLSRAIDIERGLVADFHNDYLLRESLAISLARIGAMRFELRELELAGQVTGEGRELLEHMVKHDPTNAKWRRMLAIARTDLARIAERRGELNLARAGFERGLDDFKRFATLKPGVPEAQFDIAIAYNNLGDLESVLGDFDAALKTFERALAIAKKLVEHASDVTRWRTAMATYQGKIGTAALSLGDVDRAQTAIEAGLEITAELARGDPDNIQLQRSWSIALGQAAGLSRASGQLTQAIGYYEQSLTIDKALMARAPEDAEAISDLAVTLSQLGNAHRAAGNMQRASTFYADALTQRERLGQVAPSNVAWRADAAESLTALGDVAFSQREFAQAIEHFANAARYLDALLKLYPDNQRWQRQAAFTLNRLGGAVASNGNSAKAREIYQMAHDIVVVLAASNPDNTMWQTDHALSLRLLAITTPVADVSARLGLFEGALEIVEGLADKAAYRLDSVPGQTSCVMSLRGSSRATEEDSEPCLAALGRRR